MYLHKSELPYYCTLIDCKGSQGDLNLNSLISDFKAIPKTEDHWQAVSQSNAEQNLCIMQGYNIILAGFHCVPLVLHESKDSRI